MWWGIFAALLLCLATAVAYAEISKLYPGTGSSYYYAEQALLSKDKAFKYARVAKFIVGWGSHLYYWVYPGVMVATTGIFVGYVVGFLYPNFMSGSQSRPGLHGAGRRGLLLLRGLDRAKGAGASTAVNMAINVIQISALLVFSVLAMGYRANHPAGHAGLPVRLADAGHLHLPVRDRQGRLHGARRQRQSAAAARLGRQAGSLHHHYPDDGRDRQLPHPPQRRSVVAPHKFSFMFIQATVAILILVGFESVTSMGGEAKNPTKHIPIAVIASLLIQGLFCYLFEYFAPITSSTRATPCKARPGSAAPIGDMMIIVGDALLGQGTASTSCWPRPSPSSWR
jgi:APA family basic amino acid/polyamine antiporter